MCGQIVDSVQLRQPLVGRHAELVPRMVEVAFVDVDEAALGGRRRPGGVLDPPQAVGESSAKPKKFAPRSAQVVRPLPRNREGVTVAQYTPALLSRSNMVS